ncbi:MAG: Uma2 family endonuclease [Cyanobacteria bacterium P01_A01_bin.123]
MTVATNPPPQQRPLSVDEFLSRYGGDNRYELIDGEVFDLEPTGPHVRVAAPMEQQVAGFITKKACVQIDLADLPWVILQRPLFRPPNIDMTAFRPDVAVIDETALNNEPLWHEQSILTQSSSIKLIAEVVSSNWQNDYSRKLEDYETLGIPEYWIADYGGIGGTRHIGSPKRPTLSICTLENGRYQIQQFRGDNLIVSPTFPGLTLTANQVLRAERSID